ncbi:DUF6193 family natural product biosynthesis protein [Streptomyces sp. NPDC056290]|uniref:DUF6193 family natural product biosynthesis protein n=1 Tax=Streptomyces sp. NPDC056290 TaxID=3345771 RepID=UPI0035DEFFC8
MQPEPGHHPLLDTLAYPELAADDGDPLRGHRRAAEAAGAELAPTRPWGGWDAAQDVLAVAMDSDRGTCVLSFERHRHVIEVRFTRPWIGNAAGGTVAALPEAVEMLDAWHGRLPLAEMGRRWPALAVLPFAVALEEGRAVPHRWEEVRALPTDAIDGRLVEAAHAVPRLRALFPIVSHAALSFSDTPLPPHSDAFPRATPHGEHGWLVGSQREPASAHTAVTSAEEAVAHLVRLLPDTGSERTPTRTDG